MLEVRKLQGFELRFINLGKSNIQNLSVNFDNKYSHTLLGLYSVEKGLMKDSVLRPGDTLTILFTEDIDNSIYFDINEREFVPDEIMISNNECTTKWKFK